LCFKPTLFASTFANSISQHTDPSLQKSLQSQRRQKWFKKIFRPFKKNKKRNAQTLKPSPNLATFKSIKFGKLYEKIKILREPDCEHLGIS
jgi:hypothetical protein